MLDDTLTIPPVPDCKDAEIAALKARLADIEKLVDSIKTLTGREGLVGEELLDSLHILHKDNGRAWSALGQAICVLKGSVPRDGNHHIEILELAAQAQERLALHQWRPIEMAPKDGTRILLFGCYSEPVATIGYWGGSRPETWKDARLGGRTAVNMPTRWMPLPGLPDAP